MKTLLQGKPYTPAAKTDIRKTFARIRREMKERKAKVEDLTARRAQEKRRA